MSMEDLKASKLTEEEMGDVVGGQAARTTRKRTYTVKSGDCLSVIAQNLKVKMDDLINWNLYKYSKLKENPNYIQVGWILDYYI